MPQAFCLRLPPLWSWQSGCVPSIHRSGCGNCFAACVCAGLAGAAGLMVVYWVLESTELHLALKCFSPQQAPCDTFRATMIGQFFNCITPFASGGQPMQALYLMKKGVALSFASCSLLIKFIVYQFVLTLYSAVTLALCFRQFAAGSRWSAGWQRQALVSTCWSLSDCFVWDFCADRPNAFCTVSFRCCSGFTS